VVGALIALRHWMRLSARGRLRRRNTPSRTRPPAAPNGVADREPQRS
jgi:putative membrane protein